MEYIFTLFPDYSVKYARTVLKGRFESGEKSIATDAEQSYLYASFLGRFFELGETVIATDAEYSYLYARRIIEDRFRLGEKAIINSSDPSWAYKYARDIIKGEWKEGEENIKRSSIWWEYYQNMLV